MTSPAETISSRATIRAGQEKMCQLDVECLAVLDEDRLVGIITRWDADKAMKHRLGSEPIAHFMSTPAITVRPGTTLSRMRRLMVDKGIGHLPVLGSHGLLGMVSQSNLHRAEVITRAGGPGHGKSLAEAENLAGLMRERLSPGVRRLLRRVGRFGQETGVGVFLVGGSVRDLLLKVPDVDLDIVVAGDGIAFAREFVSRHGGRMVSYRRFATALMVLPGGVKIDVVSARSERYEGPGALPNIERGALMDDLYRRDFTINSMAIQLWGRRYGRLIDPFGGRRDLRQKTIKVMHNLSFVEDPTRMIRAVRFEGRYGFRMDLRTVHLLSCAARTHMLDKISGQRLREETLILLRENDPLPAIYRLDRLGILRSLSPELKVTTQTRRLLERVRRHLRHHVNLWPEAQLDRWIVFLVSLFSVLSSSEMDRLATRLSLHRKAWRCLRQARESGKGVLRFLETKKRPPNSKLYQHLQPLFPEVMIYLMARSRSRAVSTRIVHYLKHLRDVNLEIGGRDLKEMGLPRGAAYYRILNQVLVAKLDGRLKGRTQELRLAAQLVRAKK